MAFLDSSQGMIPCKVTAIDGRDITVAFDAPPARAVHWSGQTGNAWAGRVETFRSSRIVPRAVVKGQRIGAYKWEGSTK
jgi:hypothetical protein